MSNTLKGVTQQKRVTDALGCVSCCTVYSLHFFWLPHSHFLCVHLKCSRLPWQHISWTATGEYLRHHNSSLWPGAELILSVKQRKTRHIEPKKIQNLYFHFWGVAIDYLSTGFFTLYDKKLNILKLQTKQNVKAEWIIDCCFSQFSDISKVKCWLIDWENNQQIIM